ncbi:MAG: ABC transporter permease [Acidobacteria bacterium]|nr:ABC transporter permease [Acidobacteriota bacterium]
MRDWKGYIREHLPPLVIDAGREMEIVEEMAQHLESVYEDSLARGASEQEAFTRAVAQIKDWRLLECELSRSDRYTGEKWPNRRADCESDLQPEKRLKGWIDMESLFHDLRYGWRMLRARPGFAFIAVIALALGIGANTAIFSAVDVILLRPLPYPEPERLVQVYEAHPKEGYVRFSFSLPNFVDYRDQQSVFEQIAAYLRRDLNLTGAGEPERVQSAVVSAGFLPLLRVQPFLGRAFLPEEAVPGKHRVAILSYDLWQRRFGADPRIVNQTISLSGNNFSVIGVMPESFRFPDPFGNNPLAASSMKVELLTPMAYDPKNLGDRGSHFLQVIARLKPGVLPEQAQAELRTIAGRLEQQYPTNKGWTINAFSLHDEVIQSVRRTLLVLLAAVGFVLLIACVNVANLLLARASARQKEIAVRLALGASRWRLIRLLVTENLLLSLFGGAAGLMLAYWATEALVRLSPANVPRANEIGINGRMLIFTLAVALLTGLVFGLIPAIQASKPDLNVSLKEGGRNVGSGGGSNRMRSMLVVAEIALSLLLLIGAGLMIRSFIGLQQVDTGYRTDNVMTMKVALPISKYRESQQQAAFYQQAIERIRALPGVESAGAVSDLPLSGDGGVFLFNIEGRPHATAWGNAQWRAVSTDYFRTMGMRLLRGREITELDRQGAVEVLVINEAMAKKFWPGEDPIGKRIQIFDLAPRPWREIIGVVRDIKHFELAQDAGPEMFVPALQRPRIAMTLVARTVSDPSQLAPAMREAVLSVDKDQPVYRVRTMEQFLSDMMAAPRATAYLLSALAIVAIILAAVGIYGVMSYTIAQRTHEIGIRVALGARRADVLRLVLTQGMKLAVVGIVIGTGGAVIVTRMMDPLLYGVRPNDPLTFAVVAVVLASVALLACYIPARRAMKVDPMVALRYE